MEGAHGMHSASMLERLKDQKIGQKSMTIICTVFPSGRGGRDDADVDCFFWRCSSPKDLRRCF